MVLMIRTLNELDNNVFLSAADATSMCPNINTEEGLAFLTIVLDNLMFKVEPNWPRTEIINATKLLLRFNVFQFRGTYY